MKALIGVSIRLFLAAMLLSGDYGLSTFAYYILLTLNILGWLLLIPMFSDEKAASNFKSRLWHVIPTYALLLYGLIHAEHPGLAASASMLLAFMIAAAFTKTPAEVKP